MTIDISLETIQKLEHQIPEIRARAINNVQSKFQSCNAPHLYELNVSVNDLIKHLIKWFDFKPVTNEKQVFEILLLLLKSKYRCDAVRILGQYYKRGDLQKLRIYADDTVHGGCYDEIIEILNDDFGGFAKSQTISERSKSTNSINNLCGSWKCKDVNANSCPIEGLNYERAWEAAGKTELGVLLQLKSTISTKHNQTELEHALQYFEKYIYDFPGEFFLQMPFLFTNLLELIESEVESFDHTQALTCCLKLTQNLSRRVTIRRNASMHSPSNADDKQGQVTIGSYCFKTFQSVLSLLRNIYDDSNLASVNECFLNLIEIVELICKAGDVYSMEVAVEYHIDQIIDDLTDFLRFIREMTSNYSRNGHKIHRNNAISIIFLLCRLVIFKENNKCTDDETIQAHESSHPIESILDLDISQRLKRFALNSSHPPFETMKNSDSSSNTIDEISSVSTVGNYVTATENIAAGGGLWRKELQIALLDYPLKHFYPQVVDLISYALKIECLPENSTVKVLMKLSELLAPVVTLLRDPKMCTDKQVIAYGIKSIDVLTIVKSDELAHLMFNAIINLIPEYGADKQLRTDAETLLLHMLSCGYPEVKRLTYKLISEKMSLFFGHLMDGRQHFRKSYRPKSTDINPICLFGLPISTEILTEVLCNGLSCADTKTANYAENILLLVFRAKDLLPKHGASVYEFLITVLPLSLCHASTTTKLGQLILTVVEPEEKNVLPTIVLLKSSVALLFSRDIHTQGEAVYRLLYLLQHIPNAELYMPNVRCIADTVPNNICIVDPMKYSNNEAFSHLYDAHLIKDFLDVLHNRKTDPSLRHSTLKQLNVIAEDPVILNQFYECDGHSVILKLLDKSLQESTTDNYAKNVIEIIGILSKMCIRIPSFRRQMEDDIQFYVLILRSLLLFHIEQRFKRDCAILLFSLAYSGYIVGGSREFIVPSICKRLLLPIVCEFGWTSNYTQHNLLEILIPANERSKSNNNNNNNTIDNNNLNSNASSDTDTVTLNNSNIKISQIWRYIRMCFSGLWFGSLDQLIECPHYLDGTKNTELNYKANKDSLKFNRALCVTSTDLEIIEGSSPKCGLNHWLKRLKNATNTQQVALSCVAIENFSNVDSMGHRKQWNCNLFLQSIKRFCTVSPNNKQDEIVFRKICRLLSNLIERDFIDVHIWILSELNGKSCIFLDLITDSNVTAPIFLANTKLLAAVIAKTIDIESKRIIHQMVYQLPDDDRKRGAGNSLPRLKTKAATVRNLYENVFDIAMHRLDSLLEEKKPDELRSLVSLVHLLTTSGQVSNNEYQTACASNKLLKLALAASSLSYVGSSFRKHCLMAIGHLMCYVDELPIDRKYIKFLSSLCSHVDFHIRTISWSILLKIASTVIGAEKMANEMNNLPGGLFACCLNTLLDDTETATVRENAALVFATLISHRKSNNELDERLYSANAIGLGCEWIGHLIHHQDLIGKIVASIKYVHVSDMVDTTTCLTEQQIVPCNLMRSYCIILTNLLLLKGAGDVSQIFTAMHMICRIIPNIRQEINKSSILLLTEICELMSHCISFKKSLVDLIVRELDVIQSLVSLLNVDLFESISKQIKDRCWPKITKILCRIARSPVGFQIICESFAQNPEHLDGTASLFIYGLCSKDINIPVMRFIIELMIISQNSNHYGQTFTDQLNELKLSVKVKDTVKKFIFNADVSSQSVVNWFESSETEQSSDEVYAPEILYRQLAELFERFSDCSSIKMLPSESRDKCFEYVCKSLETLLKCSDKARILATTDQFLLSIVEQIDGVYSSMGGSFRVVVRKSRNDKVENYVKKLKLLMHIIVCWYSEDCLQDQECLQPLISICHKFWPIGTDAELQTIFMKMLLFISDNSLPACKAISTTPSSTTNSTPFLNSIIEYCVAETTKPKPEHTSMQVLRIALQIITNCCCCFEGRAVITKMRMFHTLSRLHPHVTRNQKPWSQLTNYWLALYEVFTRYSDFSKETHLNLLCNLAESSCAKIRRRALEILRNLAFNADNRGALLSSPDFLRVVCTVLDKTNLDDEQLLVAVAIWKLVANNARGKNAIKNSPIMSKLISLKEKLNRHMADGQFRLNHHDQNGSHDNRGSGDETTEELEMAVNCALDILQK